MSQRQRFLAFCVAKILKTHQSAKRNYVNSPKIGRNSNFHHFDSGNNHSILSINNTQWPALVLPSWTKTPIFCMAERSRYIVRWTTDKTTDNCWAEIKGFLLISLAISFCLLDNWTTDKLLTSLTTSLTTSPVTLLVTSCLFCIAKNISRLTVAMNPPRTSSNTGISRFSAWRHRDSSRSHGPTSLWILPNRLRWQWVCCGVVTHDVWTGSWSWNWRAEYRRSTR